MQQRCRRAARSVRRSQRTFPRPEPFPLLAPSLIIRPTHHQRKRTPRSPLVLILTSFCVNDSSRLREETSGTAMLLFVVERIEPQFPARIHHQTRYQLLQQHKSQDF